MADLKLEWQSDLPGIVTLPHRIVAFLVTINPILWTILFVAIPFVVLGPFAIVGSVSAIAYLIVCACLWLMIWFSSSGLKRIHYTLNSGTKTLTIARDFTDPETKQVAAALGGDEVTVDLDDVDSVVMIPFFRSVACRLRYRGLNLDMPEGVLIPRQNLREISNQFRASDITVPDLTPGDNPRPRTWAYGSIICVFATPVLIGVLPLYLASTRFAVDIWPLLFGFVVLIGFMSIRHLTMETGIRPEGTRARDWIIRWVFDIVLALVALGITFGLFFVGGAPS